MKRRPRRARSPRHTKDKSPEPERIFPPPLGKAGDEIVQKLNRGRLRAAGLLREPEEPLDIFERWSLERNDFDAKAVAKRLDTAWRGWSPRQKQLLLRAAERIADAERAKEDWNPKATHSAQIKLEKMALQAVHLAEELIGAFPPPWEGSRKAIGELVACLAAFAGGVIDASYPWSEKLLVRIASGVLRVLKADSRQMHWELLRDLAWLASARRRSPSERTVRRYLKRPPHFKIPGRAHLQERDWEMIRKICQFHARGKSELFENAARDYLADNS